MKIYKLSIIILLACLFVGLIWKSYHLQERKNEGLKQIGRLPDLPFLFLKKGISIVDHPVIINFFHPGCEHCQYMASQIIKADSKFNKISFLMITRASETVANTFIKEFQLSKINNLSIAIDTSDKFFGLFGSDQVPSFFIYNRAHILVRQIKGEASLGILEVLANSSLSLIED